MKINRLILGRAGSRVGATDQFDTARGPRKHATSDRACLGAFVRKIVTRGIACVDKGLAKNEREEKKPKSNDPKIYISL